MLTRIRHFAAGLALLLSAPAFALDTPATVRADPALWVVKDADTTIYLFGTIHVLKPNLDWLHAPVKDALEKSDTLVLEMVQPAPEAMQQLVVTNGINIAKPTLTERVPEDKRAAYAAALAGLGLPPAAFDEMRPWLAATNLSLLPIMKMGYDPASGAEHVLTNIAKAGGKTVAGLETPEQQIGYLSGLSDAAQMTFLTSTVDELPKLGETLDTMVADWSKGDAEALAKEMNDSIQHSPEMANRLLYDRNARWADWIATRMKTPGVVFIAVGAGHLAGDKSVQADLAKMGIFAVRVKP